MTCGSVPKICQSQTRSSLFHGFKHSRQSKSKNETGHKDTLKKRLPGNCYKRKTFRWPRAEAPFAQAELKPIRFLRPARDQSALPVSSSPVSPWRTSASAHPSGNYRSNQNYRPNAAAGEEKKEAHKMHTQIDKDGRQGSHVTLLEQTSHTQRLGLERGNFPAKAPDVRVCWKIPHLIRPQRQEYPCNLQEVYCSNVHWVPSAHRQEETSMVISYGHTPCQMVACSAC